MYNIETADIYIFIVNVNIFIIIIIIIYNFLPKTNLRYVFFIK